jgi:two-component system chemotaxis sensor kinase CheA
MVYIDEKKLQLAFLEEVNELLESLNERLLALENAPGDKDTINEIFRLTHSIKSESALVGFMNLSTIAHKMEDIFERVRRGVMTVTTEIIDALFAAHDRIAEIISAVSNDQDESGIEVNDVINPLRLILDEKEETGKPQQKNTGITSSEDMEEYGTALSISETKIEKLNTEIFNDYENGQIEEGLERGDRFYQVKVHIEDECDMKYPRAYLVYNNFISTGIIIKTVPDIQSETEDEKFSEMTMYLLTTSDIDTLKDCAEVDQVDGLEIGSIDLKALSGSAMDLSNVPGYEEQILSVDDIKAAEEVEKEWQKQYEATIQQETLQEIEAGEDDPNDEISETGETETETETVANDVDNTTSSRQKSRKSNIQKHTIRVDIERLDTLLNLVGELIINRSRFNQIREMVNEQTSISDVRQELEDATNELERISDLMQMGMMQARMVPIGTVFSKFPRMVRDLANTLQKNVKLQILGETTEIDRTVIELIAEPLTHLIRNSIDHGIESPEEREQTGKPREGQIILKAYQEGSSIYIEVEDDGKGIDSDSILDKGIEKNLITQQQASMLTRGEILNLIFEPGFSTKAEVTDLSGRGVGMDVVKTQIGKLRGQIEIDTELGESTRFTIILPLTSTIVEALLVNVQRNTFAIPISVVEETLKIRKTEIEDFDDYKIYTLRDETLAINSLSSLVGLEVEENWVDKLDDEIFIVVVSFERRRIGLVVDDLEGEQDIVIKALDDVLKHCDGLAGGAILGDGRIALILDTSSLVKATIREINRKAEEYDFFKGKQKGKNLEELYDELNIDEETVRTLVREQNKRIEDAGIKIDQEDNGMVEVESVDDEELDIADLEDFTVPSAEDLIDVDEDFGNGEDDENLKAINDIMSDIGSDPGID